MRHRGALVLLGAWLLVYPPVAKDDQGNLSPDTDAPLATWQRFGAYNTAAGCQENARVVLGSYAGTLQAGTDPQKRAMAAAMTRARCVTAEQLRSAEKEESTD